MQSIFVVLLLAAFEIGCTRADAPQPLPVTASASAYNGTWWQAQNAANRDGFVSGYLDCYIWTGPSDQYSDRDIDSQIKQIDDFYRSNPKQITTSLPDVLRKIGIKQTKRPNADPHGAYDGDFWRQSTARVTFVEGYLECERLYLPNRFSKTPEQYRDALSNWYGVSDADESALNDRTANDKIGDILYKLRDGASPL